MVKRWGLTYDDLEVFPEGEYVEYADYLALETKLDQYERKLGDRARQISDQVSAINSQTEEILTLKSRLDKIVAALNEYRAKLYTPEHEAFRKLTLAIEDSYGDVVEKQPLKIEPCGHFWAKAGTVADGDYCTRCGTRRPAGGIVPERKYDEAFSSGDRQWHKCAEPSCGMAVKLPADFCSKHSPE